MDRFKLLIEQALFEKLINEGKDPVEVLHYRYQNVPSEIIDKVISIDPTNKKSFSQWLLSHWEDESNIIQSNLENGRIEQLFKHFKVHNDIQIKDCPSVSEGLRKYVPQEDTVLHKSNRPTTYIENLKMEVDSNLANDFDIVFNKDNWIIAVPNTYEAECKLGENAIWCTANGYESRDGRQDYEDYINNYGGKYYVNFDMSHGESSRGKDYPYKRYQAHFESNQFHNIKNEQVDINDIGMPESAKQFYEKIGYDLDDLYDDDFRMDRYFTQRAETEYRLNRHLTLNIAFDEDYNFVEPNANTDFYIFEDGESYEPIDIRYPVPNPYIHQDIIVHTDDYYCILKVKDSENSPHLIVIQDNDDWEVYLFNKYITAGKNDNLCFFGTNDKYQYAFTSFVKDAEFKYPEVSNLQNIFINKFCTESDKNSNGSIFVEAVSDNYHSLFAITNGYIDQIVIQDIPINGKYFTINEDLYVEGLLGRYAVIDDENFSTVSYHINKKLRNGDYLVLQEVYETVSFYGYRKYVSHEKYNIFKSADKNLLLDEWFDAFCLETPNAYVVINNHMLRFYSADDGTQIGDEYDNYVAIDGIDKGYFLGIKGSVENPKSTDIINTNEKRVLTTCQSCKSKPFNNKIALLDTDGYTVKIFDYVEGKYCSDMDDDVMSQSTVGAQSSNMMENFIKQTINEVLKKQGIIKH